MKKQKIKLNKKQQQTVDLIQSGVNVFLTGDAGTGKTTVIQQSVKGLEKDGKNVLITATTGVAADNIGMGAVTVHKAFELGIEFEKYKDIAIEKVCNLGRVNLVALVLGPHVIMLYHMGGEHAELIVPGIKKLLQLHGIASG